MLTSSSTTHRASAVPAAPLAENATSSKTPARSANNKSRRAFGDISNRKIKASDGGGGSSAAAGKPGALKTPSVTATKKQQRLMQSTAKVSLGIKGENAKSTTKPAGTLRPRVVEFVLPENPRGAEIFPTVFHTKQSWRTSFNDDDDDVEQSAGRLFSQQLDGDGGGSLLDVSLEGAHTFRQEWADACRHGRDERRRAEWAADERCEALMVANAAALTDIAVDPCDEVNLSANWDDSLVELRLDDDSVGDCFSVVDFE